MIERACAAALALALLASARADEPRLQPWNRGAAPELAGIDVGGRALDLAALRGRVVLVAFWASWCEPCADELRTIARLRDRLRGRPFELVTVNHGEGPARVEEFLRALRVEVPVLLDRDRRAGAAWGVGGLPTTFVVDARGRVRGWVFGEADWSRGELAGEVERLVGEAEGTRQARPRRDGRPGGACS